MLYRVAELYQSCLNLQNVLQCLTKCLTSVRFIKRNQTRCARFGHQTMFDCVGSLNISRFGRCFVTIDSLAQSRKILILNNTKAPKYSCRFDFLASTVQP